MLKTLGILLSFLLVLNTAQANETSKYYDVKVSPDGKHLAFSLDVEGKRTVAFLSTKDMSYAGGAKLPRLSEVGEFYWANNERVVMTVMKKEAWREEAIFYGELFATNIDGSLADMIYGYRALHDRKATGAGSRFKRKKRLDGSAALIDLLQGEERNILISSTLWAEGTKPSDTHWKDFGERLASVYKLDIYNGQINTKRIGGAPMPYSTFLAGKGGELKISYGKNANAELYIRQDQDWQQVPSSSTGKNIKPLTINSTGTHLLTLDNFKQENNGLFALELATGIYSKVDLGENVNIIDAEMVKNGHDVYALLTDEETPRYIMMNLDSVEAQIFNSMLAVFPGKQIRIASKSENDEVFIVKVTENESSTFYIYNKQTNKLVPFG